MNGRKSPHRRVQAIPSGKLGFEHFNEFGSGRACMFAGVLTM